MTSPRSLPTSLCCLPLLPVSSLKVVGALDNYSLVFVIFINFFRQLKDWVGQVIFLVSCPKGQVEKYVNVEACGDICASRIDIGPPGDICTKSTEIGPSGDIDGYGSLLIEINGSPGDMNLGSTETVNHS